MQMPFGNQYNAHLDATISEYKAFGSSLNEGIKTRDETRQFPHGSWQACVDKGLLGFAVPATYGGSEKGSELDGMIALEALGQTCRDLSLLFALSVQMWTVQHPILKFGTDDQKKRFLPRLTAGEFGAHALSEPEAGSDAFSMRTQATATDAGYILNGTKRYVSLGPLADIILVFATTDPAKGKWGISGFLVEKGTMGLSVAPSPAKMGLKSVPWGEITFKDCFVPSENLLGNPGAGFAITMASLEFERASIISGQIGVMQRQLDDSIAFAKSREQFGQPIGGFQSVSNRIVDMKLRLETVQLLSRKVMALLAAGKPATTEVALLNYHAGEAFVASSMDAMRIRGAAGYTQAHDAERELRDSLGLIFAGGTSDIQRNIVAKGLGL